MTSPSPAHGRGTKRPPEQLGMSETFAVAYFAEVSKSSDGRIVPFVSAQILGFPEPFTAWLSCIRTNAGPARGPGASALARLVAYGDALAPRRSRTGARVEPPSGAEPR
jgi:hypothetical protein